MIKIELICRPSQSIPSITEAEVKALVAMGHNYCLIVFANTASKVDSSSAAIKRFLRSKYGPNNGILVMPLTGGGLTTGEKVFVMQYFR